MSSAGFRTEYNMGIVRCCRGDALALRLFSPSRHAIKRSRAERKPERKRERVKPRATINVEDAMRNAARDSTVKKNGDTFHALCHRNGTTMSKIIDCRASLLLPLI